MKTSGLNEIKNELGIDLVKITRGLEKRFGKINVLDSGAGYLQTAAELKRHFGNKAFVSALTVAQPVLPPKQ